MEYFTASTTCLWPLLSASSSKFARKEARTIRLASANWDVESWDALRVCVENRISSKITSTIPLIQMRKCDLCYKQNEEHGPIINRRVYAEK